MAGKSAKRKNGPTAIGLLCETISERNPMVAGELCSRNTGMGVRPEENGVLVSGRLEADI